MAYLKFKPIASKLSCYKTLTKDEVKEEIEQILEPKEDIIIAFKSMRGMGVFTDKRIILVEHKGITKIQKNYYSVKYNSISTYALKIHSIDSSIELILDSGYKLLINFFKPIPLDDMFKVYRYISDFVLNKAK